MNKKELMQRSAQVTADIQVVYLGMIADYLRDNGGSLDMDFHMELEWLISILVREVTADTLLMAG